jgi:O-antigen ligase
LLLPFEHPSPLFRALGFEFTLLELAAGFTLVWMGAACLVERVRLRDLARIPLLLAAAAFLAVSLLSAAFAPEPKWLPFKFTLRITAGVAAFALASLLLRQPARIRRTLAALGVAGVAVALLALGEALQIPAVASFVTSFRSQDFEVGGTHRVAASFAYPNLAGGFLVLALPAVLFRFRRWSFAALGAGLLLFTAVLLTYSRGALAGALVAPLALALWGRSQRIPEALRQAKGALAGFLLLGAAVALSSPSFRLRAMSEGDTSWYRADFFAEIDQAALEPSELAQIPVRVRNMGGNLWTVAGSKRFHVSYHWFDLTAWRVVDLEGERTALPSEVEPGETVRVLANVRAPEESGRFLLVWDMVQEHTTWFVGKAGPGHFLPVVVGNPPALETAPDAVPARQVAQSFLQDAWFPGRLELWSIAARLFLENPLLGVGPDNFRWLYGPASGRRRWDTRVFANSLYLETLATTGLLGGIAFFALLVSSSTALFRLARRPADPESAAGGEGALVAVTLLASLAGFLVHGLFDYLLEPTAIYLAFWLLLGAASALTALAREAPPALERVFP